MFNTYLKVPEIEGVTPVKSPPSVSEIVVTKLTDSTSPLLFQEAEFFISDGTSNTAGAHTGGCNVVFFDGSIRLTDGSVFGGFDLV
jgi:prepilin-type processing-associated H-X9-DG protein